MENLKLYFLIYELKGIVSSINSLSDQGGEYYHPLTEDIERKVDEILEEIKPEGAKLYAAE